MAHDDVPQPVRSWNFANRLCKEVKKRYSVSENKKQKIPLCYFALGEWFLWGLQYLYWVKFEGLCNIRKVKYSIARP